MAIENKFACSSGHRRCRIKSISANWRRGAAAGWRSGVGEANGRMRGGEEESHSKATAAG